MDRTHEESMALVGPVWNLLEQVWGIMGDQAGWHVLYTLLEHEHAGLVPSEITPDLIAEGLILNNIPAWWVNEKLSTWKGERQ